MKNITTVVIAVVSSNQFGFVSLSLSLSLPFSHNLYVFSLINLCMLYVYFQFVFVYRNLMPCTRAQCVCLCCVWIAPSPHVCVVMLVPCVYVVMLHHVHYNLHSPKWREKRGKGESENHLVSFLNDSDDDLLWWWNDMMIKLKLFWFVMAICVILKQQWLTMVWNIDVMALGI